MSIGVFLLDDHELVRRGLRDLIWAYEDLTVVGEAANADDAIREIPRTHPDVAVLDVRLGEEEGMTGIEVCREVRSADPTIACIMLTSFSDDEAVLASVMAGASGYVLKQIHGVDLVAAIRRVAAGESLLDPPLAQRALERVRAQASKGDPLSSLTPQERRVLEFIADGKTNRQIGEAMFLTEKTVKNYVSNVLSKLGMQRRSQAAAFAARLDERKGIC